MSLTARLTAHEKEEAAKNTEIAKLTTECAVKDGVNQTLQGQNRDQQSTINGCLSQAIKLLTPEALKITAIGFDVTEDAKATIKSARTLLITNKIVDV